MASSSAGVSAFLLLCSLKLGNASMNGHIEEHPRLLEFRSGAHYFVRLNGKLSIFNYTTIFEWGYGYRINYDVKAFDEIRSHREKRLALHRSFEAELEKYGLEGRACVSRIFCEMDTMSQYEDLITRMLRLLFRAHDVYTCPQETACPISLAWVPYLLYKNNSDYV